MKVFFVALLLASPVAATECATGCFQMESGVCACDQASADIGVPSVKPSNESIGEYRADKVVAAMPASLAAQDAKQDQDKTDADMKGKIAAGIK